MFYWDQKLGEVKKSRWALVCSGRKVGYLTRKVSSHCTYTCEAWYYKGPADEKDGYRRFPSTLLRPALSLPSYCPCYLPRPHTGGEGETSLWVKLVIPRHVRSFHGSCYAAGSTEKHNWKHRRITDTRSHYSRKIQQGERTAVAAGA